MHDVVPREIGARGRAFRWSIVEGEPEMPPEAEIAVTGATGEIGGRVAARLAERSVPQRLVVRDADRAPSIDRAEVAVASSYADSEGMRRALDGMGTLFLVSGRESIDRLEQHLAAVDAARGAGVERIVYLSFLGAAPDATFTLARQHFATEEHVRASGARHTFLRSSMYADFVPYFAGAEGVIRGPAGSGRVAWVARDDIADVAVSVLLGEGHDGRTYDMTGPEALTMAETAAILGRVTGRPISYLEETLKEARASRAPTGAPDWEIVGWVTSYAAIASGEMDVVSDNVERLTGHPPWALEPFLRANLELSAHLID
jgi:NAD(P)H dehydrogenase (quinone)